MKKFLILLLFLVSVITTTCKKDREVDIPVDDSPFSVTHLMPLSDDVPYQSLGSGKIMFERAYNTGGSEFYIIDIDNGRSSGFKLRSQTTQPGISPDGSRIVCSLRNADDSGSDFNIYLMNPDGSECFPAFRAGKRVRYPSWNSDGSKIVFYTSGDQGRLYMQSPVKNSSDTVLLTAFQDPVDPQWLIKPSGGFGVTPGGNLIGLSSSPKPSGIIKIIPYAGKSGISILISPSDLAFISPDIQLEAPAISPDGLEIAFLAMVPDDFDASIISLILFTMKSDGTSLIAIGGITAFRPPTGDERFVSLCWSPDGTKILFTVPDAQTTCHLYLVNIDGSGSVQVTNQHGVFDSNVSWGR